MVRVIAVYGIDVFLGCACKDQRPRKAEENVVKNVGNADSRVVGKRRNDGSTKGVSVLVPDGNIAAYSFLMFAFSSLLLYAAYFFLCIVQKKEVKTEKKWKPLSKVLLICGAFLAFAVFVVNMLVTELGKTVESAILFSVSYAISIIITILVGALYYKEKITWKNALGIVLCVGSLAIINFL